ncbi:MAG: hypothetical protein LBJ17_06735 [Dysgonamonadaceae bacterium]|jgi:hypothetical protein|nr:hypothetical protein [Dysgonamonadaceae bacterium]
MAKQTSFAHQKQVLEQLQTLLTGLERNFRDLFTKHEERVTSLYQDEGLMEEIYDDYITICLTPLKDSLDGLSRKIQEEDIPFVEKELDFIASR